MVHGKHTSRKNSDRDVKQGNAGRGRWFWLFPSFVWDPWFWNQWEAGERELVAGWTLTSRGWNRWIEKKSPTKLLFNFQPHLSRRSKHRNRRPSKNPEKAWHGPAVVPLLHQLESQHILVRQAIRREIQRFDISVCFTENLLGVYDFHQFSLIFSYFPRFETWFHWICQLFILTYE